MDYKVKYSTMIVKDMDESIDFYKKMFGFEVDSQYKPAPGIVITLMKSKAAPDGAMVELIKNPTDPVGFWSVGIDVPDMETAIKELKAKGAKITMEPMPTLVGSCAFMEDINGVRLALVEHK